MSHKRKQPEDDGGDDFASEIKRCLEEAYSYIKQQYDARDARYGVCHIDIAQVDGGHSIGCCAPSCKQKAQCSFQILLFIEGLPDPITPLWATLRNAYGNLSWAIRFHATRIGAETRANAGADWTPQIYEFDHKVTGPFSHEAVCYPVCENELNTAKTLVKSFNESKHMPLDLRDATLAVRVLTQTTTLPTVLFDMIISYCYVRLPRSSK
jgi:hypothetical protein